MHVCMHVMNCKGGWPEAFLSLHSKDVSHRSKKCSSAEGKESIKIRSRLFSETHAVHTEQLSYTLNTSTDKQFLCKIYIQSNTFTITSCCVQVSLGVAQTCCVQPVFEAVI